LGENNGVTISLKEMFDLIQEMARGQQRIESRLESLESRWESASRADERAREALALAKNLEDDVKDLKDTQTWLWRTLMGTAFTAVLSLMGLIVTLVIKFKGGM
jgi:hypothetical protein